MGMILPGACFTARMSSLDLRMGTAKGRWVVAAAVLGSGVAFLDGTVVNAALPAIADDLHANLGDLQWVLTGYLLTLGSLLVLGRLARRPLRAPQGLRASGWSRSRATSLAVRRSRPTSVR